MSTMGVARASLPRLRSARISRCVGLLRRHEARIVSLAVFTLAACVACSLQDETPSARQPRALLLPLAVGALVVRIQHGLRQAYARFRRRKSLREEGLEAGRSRKDI